MTIRSYSPQSFFLAVSGVVLRGARVPLWLLVKRLTAWSRYYYRFLLKLSLDGRNDWFNNFANEKRLNEQKAAAAEHAEAATKKAVLDVWKSTSNADVAVELTESLSSDRSFQMDGQYAPAPGVDMLRSGAAIGLNGYARGSSPPRFSRSPPRGRASQSPESPSRAILQDLSEWAETERESYVNGYTRGSSPRRSSRSPPRGRSSQSPESPSGAILQDLSEWVDTEREEWNHSPLKQRQSPVGLDTLSPAQQSPDKSPEGSKRGVQVSLDQFDLNRRASWGSGSPRVDGGLSRIIPENSPQDVAAYQDFQGLSDAFRVWSEHMLALRVVREEKARALELYIDALDSWARRVSAQTLAGWRRVVDRNQKARRHVLLGAWRRFSAAQQVLRLRLAPFREVHPVLVLGVLMLRRQGRPRWMSTVDATETGAYAGDISKPTHCRRIERGQHALRIWYIEQLFHAWVQHTNDCFDVLGHAVRHWAGTAWSRHFVQWRRYVSAVRHHFERMAAAEHHASAQNARMALRAWRDYISRLFSMRKKVAQFTTVTRLLGMAPYLQAWAGHCKKWATVAAARIVSYAKVIFDTWNVRTMKHVQQRERVLKLMGYMRTSMQQQCFQSWKYFSKVRVLHREIVAERLHSRVAKMDRKVSEPTYKRQLLNKWRAWTKDSRRIKKALNRIISKWQRAHQRSSFRSWLAYLDLLDEQAAAARHCAATKAYKELFPPWKRYATHRTAKRRKAMRASLYSWTSSVAKALYTWLHFVKLRRKLKVWLEKAHLFNSKRSWELAQCLFIEWKRICSRKRRLQDAAVKCEAQRGNQLRRRYIRLWSAQYAQNSNLKAIMAKWRSKAVLELFQCWTTFTLLSKQLKLMVGRAEHFLRPRMLRFLWDTFVAGVSAIRAKRKLVMMALMHDTRQQSMQIFILWQEWVDRKLRRKELLKVADFFFLKREFRRWKEWTRIKVAYAEKAWMALKYLSNDTRRKALAGWRQAAATEARLRMAMRKILERQINKTERAMFSRWRNLMYAVRLHCYLAQKRALSGWHGVVQKEAKIRLVLGRIMNAAIARAFGSWRAVVVQSQALNGLLANVNSRVAQQSFHLWQNRCKRQVILRIFAGRTRLGFLTACWTAFRKAVATQTAADLHLQQVVCTLIRDAWYKCHVHTVVVRWARYAHICAVCGRIQLVSADKILREIVGGWRKFAAKQVTFRRVATRIIGKIRNKCVSIAWNSWEEFTRRSVEIKTFAIGLLTSAIKARFDRWVRHTSVGLQRSRRVAEGTARRRVLTLTSHLHKWFTLTKLLQQVSRLLGAREDVTTRKVFSRWVTKIDNKIEMREAIAFMETELKLRPVCGSIALECARRWATLDTGVPFAHWVRVWHIKKTRSAAHKVGLMKHFAGYRRRCFASWAYSVQLSIKGMACVAKLRSKDMKLTFDMWCDRVEHDRLLRIKSRDAMVHQEAFLQRMTFSLWRRQVRLSQGVLFMLHHRAYRYVTQAFGQWSIQTVIWANKSHRDLRARCHWALALLFGTFSSWAEGVAAIKMAKHSLSLHKFHLASVRLDQHLRAWHRTAGRRHRLRTASIWMWARNYQARYLTGWLLVVASSIAMKRKVLLAEMNVRRRYFIKWRHVAKRLAGIFDVATCWWVAFSSRTCFSEWTRHVTLRKMYLVVERQFYDARKPQVLRAHLHHWQFTVEAEIKFRQIMRHFEPVRNFHGLLAHFQAWWKMTGILQRDRIVKAEIEHLHAGCVQCNSLQRWRRQYKLKVGFRRHKHKHFCLKTVVAWHAEARRCGNYKRSLYRMMNRVAYSAFLQWSGYVAEKKRLRQLAQQLLRRLRNQSLNKAIVRWRRYTADRQHRRWQVDKACEHYKNILLKASSHEFFAAMVKNWEHKRWVKSLLLRFRRVILRRCVCCWILGNVVNRLEFARDDNDEELNANICALLAAGDRKAARSLAIHRNMISRWQMRYYCWVFGVLSERLRKRLGCQRVLRRMLNLACEAAFHRWKGLTIAIYRGRELRAWRDTGRVAEGFEAWRWMHGKILAVNAGVLRRALRAWHQRITAEKLCIQRLLGLCGKCDMALQKNGALHARLVRKALCAWRRVAHRAVLLANAELNAMRVLSGYRFFVIWQQFLDHKRSKRATLEAYARHYGRALLRSAFADWRIRRACLHGDKILLRCFFDSSDFLRKRLAVERWQLYTINKRRVFVHRAMVLRFRRQRRMQIRLAITRERARMFWSSRNEAYDKWKRDKKMSLPGMWNTGVGESPRHLISSLTAEHLHPLEYSPTKKRFQDDPTATSQPSRGPRGPTSGLARSAALPSAFTDDRSSLSVPKVSHVRWIQTEFEEDIKAFKQKQEADLNDTVKAMKRADVLMLVDMYLNSRTERAMRFPFEAWKDLVRLFGERACATKRYDLQFVTLEWTVDGITEYATEYHRLNQVRVAFAFWLIRRNQHKMRRNALPHKARMNSSITSDFIRGGSRTCALAACLRAWRKATAHSNRTFPVLEEKALRYYRRAGRRSTLRSVWAVWAQLRLHCALIRHARHNLGGVCARVVFGNMWRWVLRSRLEHQRLVWCAGKRSLHQLRTSLIAWRVLVQVSNWSFPKSPQDQDDTLSIDVAAQDTELESFVCDIAKVGRTLTLLVE